MDAVPPFTRGRGRGAGGNEVNGRGRQSKNKTWVSGSGSRSGTNTPNHIEGDRWERGGHRGSRGREQNRPRSFPNASLVVPHPPPFENLMSGDEDEDEYQEEDENEQEDELNEDIEEPELDTPEAREKFYQELVKAREVERKKAIAEGKMDDPLIPKRLEDAINLVGTCLDMAPRFERYRRERENNLFEWETIPGTKRVDHKRAVKMYERAAGDKTLPSDLRPPIVLKKTLDYLFHELLPREGFSRTFNFVRDRSRAVRNDFTMQHETGPLAIECHDRCARFHILALHFERDRAGFSIALEEQQLMNTLQSLKEFYEDQRGRYESPTELEMRVYHRLIHIRDQKERHEDIPSHITDNPVFKLTTRFRQHVQAKSAPISKTSKLVVDEQGMEIFGELAMVLREQGSVVMIYLVACILERLFGPDTIDDIEGIRGDLSIPDIIDGVTTEVDYDENLYDQADEGFTDSEEPPIDQTTSNGPSSLGQSGSEWPKSNFSPSPTPLSVFDGSSAAPIPSNPFSGTSAPPQPARSAFSNLATTPNAFGNTSVFTVPKSEPSTSVFASATAATASSSAPTPDPFASVSPFGTTSPFNAFASTSGTQSAFGNPPAASAFGSKAENPKAVGTNGPFSMPTGASSIFGQTVPSSFAQAGTSSTPTNGINGSHLTKIKEAPAPAPPEMPSQSLSFARFSAERRLNPAAAPFTPIFKPTPSPLRHDSTDKPSGTEGAASSSPWTPSQSLGNSKVISASTPAPLSTWSSIPQTSMIDAPEAKIIHTSPSLNLASSPRIPSPTTTHPTRPRINTTAAETNIVQPRSPLPQPPPLNKHQTISLPPTPTVMSTTSSLPSPGAVKQTKSILDSLKGSLETGVAAPSEILSPLVLSSAGSSRSVHNFTNVGSHPASPLSGRKTSSDKVASPLDRMPWINGKGKEHDTVLRARAMDFARKGALVRDCFDRWRARLTDRLAWAEACRRSDAYSIKIQRERVSESPVPDRKRRATLGVSSETPQRKRARKVSGDYKKPYSDEELARRFKANHEEHERRWAEGSFLQAIRKHVKRTSGTYPPGWQIWLSMNPESDATAIWLERKFDVPASGQWNTENIFAIPLKSSGDSPNSPGVIVFECTPLEGVMDEIERKYRVLDDCSRLRDIIDALPARRHFVPCLLTVSWVHTERKDTSSDLYHMISRMIGEGVLGGHQDFPIASETKALDDKLEEALVSLTLDFEGKLVQSLSVQGIFHTFESAWKDFSFSAEWLGACSTSGDFDWYLYRRFVDALISLLNVMASSALGLVQSRPIDVLPCVSAQSFLDSDTVYDTVISWLETNTIRDIAGDVLRDLQSQRSMNREFPSGAFVDHLYALTVRLTERRMGGETTNFYLLKTEITSAHQQVESTANSLAVDLRRTFALRARRSPKRRSSFDESDTSRFSTPSKKRKISLSNTSTPSDDASQSSSPPYALRLSPSPTASVSTAPGDAGVSVAMLRALTKDIKAKYGSSPLAKG